ncbi:MAG: type II toxin-antitoxin system HicB family antitoxin [Planctomycetaceae bacterium]|nr:type II toxin-antitoxin system HicB family antitoxin [Planctomycetaceae bacterium]
MRREFSVIIEKDEKGWLVASVPELKGCHTQAKSMDKLLERVREAIAVCLEAQEDTEDEVHEFVGVQRVAVES